MKEGSKYYPLFLHLRERNQKTVELTLSEIEAILGESLPQTAVTDRGWWSNRGDGALQSQFWMEAGYHVTAVDLTQKTVTFQQPKLHYEAVRVDGRIQWTGELVNGLRRHLDFSQEQLADLLGVRQQTISEWERGAYQPGRSTSNYLSMVAEQNGFQYIVKESTQTD